MNPQERLRVLIPHWIEHNQEHASEIRRWVDASGAAAPDVLAAAEALIRANEALAIGLQKLGGALKAPAHDH